MERRFREKKTDNLPKIKSMSSKTTSIRANGFKFRAKEKDNSFTKGKTSTSGSQSSSSVSTKDSISELISKIQSMKNLADISLSNLDSTKKQELQDMRNLAMLLRKGKGYALLINAIKETYGDKSNIKPGTVGAFFYGCFMGAPHDGKLACSAFCAGSIPVPETPGWKECEKSVGILQDGKLEVTQVSGSSDEMIIHVIEDNFTGLSEKDIRKIQEMGVKNITVTKMEKSGQGQTMLSGAPKSFSRESFESGEDFLDEKSQFDESECKRTQKTSCPVKHSFSGPSCHIGKSSSFSSFWIVAVIILLLVVFVAFFLFYRYWGASSPASTAVTTTSVTTAKPFYGPGYM